MLSVLPNDDLLFPFRCFSALQSSAVIATLAATYLLTLTTYEVRRSIIFLRLNSSAGQFQLFLRYMYILFVNWHRSVDSCCCLYWTVAECYCGVPRGEDCLRLLFVDDLCLQGAMQGFLTRDSSHKARLTKRHLQLSNCNAAIARKTSHVPVTNYNNNNHNNINNNNNGYIIT